MLARIDPMVKLITAALLLATTNVSGSLINGVTLNGDITISGANAGLRVSGGLTLNGTLHLTSSNAHVSSFGNETFDGNGTISFEGTSGSPRLSKKKLSSSRRRTRSTPALTTWPCHKCEISLLIPSVRGAREAVENGVMGSVVGNTRSEPTRS